MQCPRCGLQNSPGVTACARCGLPVGSAPGGVSAQPGSSSAASSGGAGRLVAATALGLAAVLAIGFAVWEFTARRGIFQHFVDGQSVSVSDARSNDRLDTTWLIVTAAAALVALALWLMRKVDGDTTGGPVDNLGLVLAVLGVVAVVVGLYLAGGVGDAADQATSGQRGVSATMVIGSGFAVLAIGLVLGMLAARGGRVRRQATSAPAAVSPPPAGSYQAR